MQNIGLDVLTMGWSDPSKCKDMTKDTKDGKDCKDDLAPVGFHDGMLCKIQS